MRHWRPLFLIVALAMTISALRQSYYAEAQPAPKSYDPCTTEFHFSQPISIATSGTVAIVPADPNNNGPINVCAINAVIPSGATLALVGGTGTACGTGQVKVTGAFAASTITGNGAASIAVVPTSDDLCYVATGGGAQGVVSYVRYVGKGNIPTATQTQTPTATPT